MNINTIDIIDLIKSFNSSTIQIIEDGSILIEDLLKDIDYEYFNIEDDLEKYRRLKIIAIIETSPLLKDKCFDSDIIYLYLLLDEKEKHMYIGIDYLHPHFWDFIEIKDLKIIKNKIDKLLELYCPSIFCENNGNDSKFENCIRRFIGTENSLGFSFDEIENFIIENKFCEYFMWGSNWNDFPYRENILNNKYSRFQIERMMTYALKQNNKIISISTRTKASKSIIKFEYNRGAIILEIKYNNDNNCRIKELNNKFKNNYPYNLPLDVLGTICQFDLIDYKDLLTIETLSINSISLSLELINKEESLIEFLSILDRINTKELCEETIKYIDEISTIININLKINKINLSDIENKIKETINQENNEPRDFIEWLKCQINVENNNELINDHLKKVYFDIIQKYKKID